MVIAIDGPAGAGKSTVARRVAEALGELAWSLDISFDHGSVQLGGKAVEGEIRAPEISVAASHVSVHPQVRQAMVKRQRELIATGSYVAEGRDIGTVVSPDAPLKVFLTASGEERARRRARQTGEPASGVLEEIEARDRRDSTREHGALRLAPESVELDTTELSAEQVVERVVELARVRGLA